MDHSYSQKIPFFGFICSFFYSTCYCSKHKDFGYSSWKFLDIQYRYALCLVIYVYKYIAQMTARHEFDNTEMLHKALIMTAGL